MNEWENLVGKEEQAYKHENAWDYSMRRTGPDFMYRELANLKKVREEIEKEGYAAQKQGIMIRPKEYDTAFKIFAWNIGYDRAWQETEK